MKKYALALLAVLTLGLSTLGFAKEETLDQTVAIVNDDIITQSELNTAVSSAKIEIAQEQIAPPNDHALKKQVLDQLINKKLQIQAAHQAGLDVSDTELEDTITGIAKRNHITINQLYSKLSDENMTVSDYRNELRDQLLIQKLQQQEVAGKIAVTPQEITAFLHSKVFQANASREYHLQDILIPTGDNPSPEAIEKAKQRAQVVLKQIQKGMDFQKAALAESGSDNALQGGDLGWRPLAEVPTAFANKVLSMNKNDIAGPVQTPNGFHIIRLTDVRGNATASNMPDRKTVENMLLQQKFEQAVQNWVMKLRSQAFITLNDFHFSHQA